jgi:hypothetical protein
MFLPLSIDGAGTGCPLSTTPPGGGGARNLSVANS